MAMMTAGVRSGLAFVGPAWGRAWWLLGPCAMAFALCATRQGGPLGFGAAIAFSLAASTGLYRLLMDVGGSWLLASARMLAAWLLTLALLAVLGLLLFVILLCAAYAVASAGAGFDSSDLRTWASAVDGRGRIVLAVVGFTGVAALLWAMTRVSLGPAATVSNGRVQVLSVWPLTRKLGMTLLAVRTLITLPVAALFVLSWRLDVPPSLGQHGGASVLAIVAGVVAAGVWLPMNAGFMAYIYKRCANNHPGAVA